MKTLSLLLLMGGSMALGLVLGWRFLRQHKNRPVHIALHLLLGLAGLECMAMLRRGAPDGAVVPAETWGNAAAIALAVSLISGFVLTVVGQQWGRRVGLSMLALHASLGAAGFALFAFWLVRTPA